MLKHISRNIFEKYVIILLIILFCFGLLFHALERLYPVTLYISDGFLLFASLWVIYFLSLKNKAKTLYLWIGCAFIFTYIIELLGVKTGHIFGHYWYGSTFKIQVFAVPLIIPLNWSILILGTHSLASKITTNKWIVPVLSSIFIVAFDFMLEPLAMKLDYWQWENQVIPVQNYLMWFILSFILSCLIAKTKINTDIKILRFYIIAQLIFFIFLRLIPIPI